MSDADVAAPGPGAQAPGTRAPRRRRALVAALAAVVLLVAGGLALWRPWEPPVGRALALSGELRTHDPALVVGAEGEPWFVYSTGDVRVGFGAPQIRRSDDGGTTWETAGTAWDVSGDPAWVRDEIDGVTNFWAPALYEHDGTWYLYYSASTFGSNASAIGVATGTTIDPADADFGWTDQGMVLRSTPGETNYNAIDPTIIEDADGTPWMVFGSFWGGIQIVELEWPSGKVAAGAQPQRIASRIGAPNAIEGPEVVRHDGWYYLFVSRDACCQGTDSTYNIAVGRSRDVTGPYLDQDGRDMALGAGTLLLASTGDVVGPGGQSVSDGRLAFHYYDAAAGGDFRLGIHELAWDEEGWPVAAVLIEN
ncbi:arabinan endo-1,5-alpha-L-arabinosidase [Flavimobilis sp. GY10621]|uniref:Arabinan endo-1,5-alpha-L-arabinosidase n=1 Tax=Flavimobilis rhizosphaerae TaxID=2775421 RepID=A0ABR9DND8_9MICO|nr:arabinan endo-1,5-alpha-L-arabinosidase [Flavimobilis rhizosphaerae]MBD9698644.1 arabinan endo-1,5-alpha-L-arabinosidase [Flavimobilis rhizosphaerae]